MRWHALGASSYTFHYRVDCFCPYLAGAVTVAEGRVTAFVADAAPPAGLPVRTPTLDELPTIDVLLDEAARAEREATGTVAITYDDVTGAPVHAAINWAKDTPDAGVAWEVRELVVTAGQSTA